MVYHTKWNNVTSLHGQLVINGCLMLLSFFFVLPAGMLVSQLLVLALLKDFLRLLLFQILMFYFFSLCAISILYINVVIVCVWVFYVVWLPGGSFLFNPSILYSCNIYIYTPSMWQKGFLFFDRQWLFKW